MNLLYLENYFVFSIFFALLTIEVGIAIVSLLDYKRYSEKLKTYLLSIWGITGTFGIFYLVSLEATYSGLLNVIGNAYVVPAFLAGMFFFGRNVFLAYSEFIAKVEDERKYSRIYAISIIIVAFLALATLVSAISGIGIDLSSNTINLTSVLLDPFAILLFIVVAVMSVFAVSVHFEIKEYWKTATLLFFLAIVLLVMTLYLYLPYVLNNLLGNFLVLIAAILLLALALMMYLRGSKFARYTTIPIIILLVNIFGVVQYPYIFGGNVDVTKYLVNPVAGAYISIFTPIGLVLLGIALGYFVYLNRKKSKKGYSKY